MYNIRKEVIGEKANKDIMDNIKQKEMVWYGHINRIDTGREYYNINRQTEGLKKPKSRRNMEFKRQSLECMKLDNNVLLLQ